MGSTNSKTKSSELQIVKWEGFYDVIPHAPLLHIYKYLPGNDLVNAQNVCRHWHKVAQNKRLWSDKTLVIADISRKSEYEKKFQNSPFLQNVNIIPSGNHRKNGKHYPECHDQVVDSICLHFRNLRSLDCGTLHHATLFHLLVKFSKIKRLSFHCYIQDMVIVLFMLTHLKDLEELKLKFYIEDEDVYIIPDERYIVTQTFINDFSKLKCMNLTHLQKILSDQDIMIILQCPKEHLQDVTLEYSNFVAPEVLTTLSKCTDLKLQLTINKLSGAFDLEILKDLRSLKLHISTEDLRTIGNTLTGDFCMPNVDHFCIRYISSGNSSSNLSTFRNLVKSVIVTFPRLESLEISSLKDKDINKQLENIASLCFLQSLKLQTLPHLNTLGFEHLRQCCKLRTLHLSDIKLKACSLSQISKCSSLRRIIFENCIFKSSHLLAFVCSLQHLLELCIVRCRDNLINPVLKAIKTKCHDLNISLCISPEKRTQRWFNYSVFPLIMVLIILLDYVL